LDPPEAQATEYANSELCISVRGRFFHVGVGGKLSPLMSIEGNLMCGRTAKTRMEVETVSMVPEAEREQKAKEAN
jgi:hypothetical protein